jgi:hypothetical protein
MGLFDKIKDTATQAKDKATQFAEDKGIAEKINSVTDSAKKALDDTSTAMKAHKEEVNELKKPLDGAIARYEFTYQGGLEDVPKPKSGAWGMNIMPDMFAFRVTITTKDWLYNLDIPYDDVTDIRVEKRTISTSELLLGAGDSANQQQENVIVIEYNDVNGKKATLRVEMLTGVTIFNQAAKCKELMDLLRRENILDKLKKSDKPVVQADDPLAQLEKLSKLKDAGILSEDEFNAKKADLLAKI